LLVSKTWFSKKRLRRLADFGFAKNAIHDYIDFPSPTQGKYLGIKYLD